MTQPIIELTLTLSPDATALDTSHLCRILKEVAEKAGAKLEVSDWNRGARPRVRRKVGSPNVE